MTIGIFRMFCKMVVEAPFFKKKSWLYVKFFFKKVQYLCTKGTSYI